MASLQEQFLKSGLVDKTKAKLANQDKSKQKKVERRSGTQSVDEVRLAALETQRKNAERAREANAQRDAAALPGRQVHLPRAQHGVLARGAHEGHGHWLLPS